MDSALQIGFAEVDITPPVGTSMMGGLLPRPAEGADDPLILRVMVVVSGETSFIQAACDLAGVDVGWMDHAAQRIHEKTGVPADHILLTCSHTHSGPYTNVLSSFTKNPVWKEANNDLWMQELEERFVACAVEAWESRSPSSVKRTRAYCVSVLHNRRLLHKSGHDVNTWLIGMPEDEENQCVGSSGVTDPEIGMLTIHGADGTLRGVVWTYALHANAHFGTRFSADYPGVVERSLRSEWGDALFCMYLPGACGDINPFLTAEETGTRIAGAMLPALKSIDQRPFESSSAGFVCTTITIPTHDFSQDGDERIAASRWPDDDKLFFEDSIACMREKGIKERTIPLAAWHIGQISFATYPLELFVEWGCELKAKGAFPWTFPIELTNGWIGYAPTEKAWERMGYESIPSVTNQIPPQSTEILNRTHLTNLEMLFREHASGMAARA